MCTLRSFKHRVQRRPLFLIQQRFHAILVELSPTPCAYSHSCVSPRSHPGAGLTIDFLSSFLFFFRFLEFSLESSSPKRSCQIPPKTASNNTQRIVSLYNANSRKTTRPRETSESRDSYTLPSSSVDRSILSRLQTSTRGGNPTSRAPNLFHAKNARLDIKFASRMIRDRYDFTEEEKRSLHRFSMHLLSLSPFSSSFLSIQSFHPSPFNLILSSRALRKGSN